MTDIITSPDARVGRPVRQVSRRHFLTKTVPAVGAAAAGATGLTIGVEKAAQAIEQVNKTLKRLQGPFNRAVIIEQGSQKVTFVPEGQRPPVIEIMITPTRDNPGRIVYRRLPNTEVEDADLPYDTIQERVSAIRRFGGSYPGLNDMGDQTVEFDGQTYHGGFWYELVDRFGQPLTPQGKSLPKEEKHYYLSGNLVTVLPKQQEQGRPASSTT